MKSADLFVEPKTITDINECYFYHTVEIPGHGLLKGEWDLRGGEKEYLGNTEFKGKRVLEIGPASGALSFFMESQGADVVAYDLSDNQTWDVVPFVQTNYDNIVAERRAHIKRINNGFWFLHAMNNSNVKMVNGTVYEIPDGVGKFDIAILGCVLLHLREPFLAFQNVLKCTNTTVVVTELHELADHAAKPIMEFVPNPDTSSPWGTWWRFSPEVIRKMLGVFGFSDSSITYHSQTAHSAEHQLFTIVAHRTVGEASGSMQNSEDLD